MIRCFFLSYRDKYDILYIMKEITKETLKIAARKMMFELSDEECDALMSEMDIIVSEMNLISDIEDVDNQEPMVFPFDMTNDYLREDEPTAPIDKSEALKNAKDVIDGMIGLPRVIK